jgi:hypothetical protein
MRVLLLLALLFASAAVLAARPAARRAMAGTGSRKAPSQRHYSPKAAELWAMQESATLRTIERGLASWKPGKEERLSPTGNLRNPSMSLQGTWLVHTGMDHSELSLTPASSGGWNVVFSTGGCLSSWTLKRTAAFRDGVLRLNRPVEEYAPRTYRLLHAVRRAGRDYLVPAPSLAEFEKEAPRDRSLLGGNVTSSFYAYDHVEPRGERNPRKPAYQASTRQSKP